MKRKIKIYLWFQDLLYDKDNQEDMSTEEDDSGILKLQKEAEERRKKYEYYCINFPFFNAIETGCL